MLVEYGAPLPCPNCGSSNIHCVHSFGGQCCCGDCGIQSAKVSGNNWQQEEYDAVIVWNSSVSAYLSAPYEIQKTEN